MDNESEPISLALRLERLKHALTAHEVAEILSISPGQVYKMAASRKLPSLRIAGSVRFDPGAIAEFLRAADTHSGPNC